MRKKCILFDMDGVLMDSEVGSFTYTQKVLEKRGIKITLEKLLENVGKTSVQTAEKLIKEYSIDETVEEFLHRNRLHGNYYANCKHLPVMDGIYGFLDMLYKKEMRMAVVSSTRSESVLTALNRSGILHWMDAVICGDMVCNPKPDPEGYLTAARLLEADSAECVVFEDSPTGIKAARAAGMKTIAFKGSVLKQDTSKADMEFSCYKECEENIEEILK